MRKYLGMFLVLVSFFIIPIFRILGPEISDDNTSIFETAYDQMENDTHSLDKIYFCSYVIALIYLIIGILLMRKGKSKGKGKRSVI